MKIFLDTNIFLDLLLKREKFCQALQIIQLVQDKLYDGYVADISLLNIAYVAKQQKQDILPFLSFIATNFNVSGADNADILEALKIHNNDLEDNVQYVLAKKSLCDFIVSNDKDFIQAGIPVFNSDEFLVKYNLT